MTNRTSQTIVENDRQALYIGNLNTVEFDLTLPAQGPNGSSITWESKDTRFLETNGKVHRPPYGMGSRTIDLFAVFRHGDASVEKTYQVRILEEEPKIDVEYVYPIEITAEAGCPFNLPGAAVIRTKNQEIFSHLVKWAEGSSRCFDTPGEYTFTGEIEELGVQVCGKAHVVQHLTVETMNTACSAEPFDNGEALLTPDSSFYLAQQEMLEFLLSLDANQMLYSFREACQLDTKGAPPMDGWDSPDSLLRGHTTGHFLSALALCYKVTGDQDILQKAVYMIDSLAECQEKFEEQMPGNPGFLSAYTDEQFDLLEEYTPYPKIWAPYYTLHKIFAGLLECYKSAGIKSALTIAEKLGLWTYHRLERLSHEQRMRMWGMYIAGEFGGMNDVLAELYLLTKNEKFLIAARYFDNDKLFSPMEHNINALNNLHANQHIPQILGAMKLFEATGEKRCYKIAENFWEMAVASYTYVIGGIGEGEMFRKPDCIAGTLSNRTAESCASYNMLKLTKELYKYNPKVSYMDYYERTLMNHILASKDHSSSGESTYFFPLAPGFRREFECENSCCHGTGMESHFKYAESVFWHDKENIYVNLFLSAKLCWAEKGIVLKQTVREDAPGNIVLELENTSPVKLFIRMPYWTDSYTVHIDGQEVSPAYENGYLVLEQNAGHSKIEISFACGLYLEHTKDDTSICSLKYGPYVLAALSDDDFLKLSLSDKNVHDKIRKEKMSLDFYYEDVHFIPVWKLNDENYQVYFKTII